jgi:hypothetical protein
MVKWAILGVVALLGVIYVGTVFGFRSDCIRAEAGIKAQHAQNRNNYDNMWKKFRETAQVQDSYAKDMEKVFKAAIEGRYGENGSQAVFQFIKEHNPQLDPAVYLKLQTIIEAGRNGFEADQKQLIDKKREYEVLLGSTRSLFVNVWLGFPRIDLDKYDIVTSDRTEDAFKNKKDDEIKLRD